MLDNFSQVYTVMGGGNFIKMKDKMQQEQIQLFKELFMPGNKIDHCIKIRFKNSKYSPPLEDYEVILDSRQKLTKVVLDRLFS